MNQKKSKIGAVEVTMSADEFNSILTILDEMTAIGSDTKPGFYACRLKEKMLRYSRKFQHNSTRKTVTHFYENEAALLIKLLAFYCNAIEICGEDYYESIRKDAVKNGSE